VEQTYYRWRKEFGGLKVDQARRLKELDQENAKLKRPVSELSLERHVAKKAIEDFVRCRVELIVLHRPDELPIPPSEGNPPIHLVVHQQDGHEILSSGY
jgi:hypothetical protein